MRVTAIGGSRDQIPQQNTTTLRHIVRPQPLDAKLNINFSRCASDRCFVCGFLTSPSQNMLSRNI